jgi:hypothetical protein
LGAVVDKWQDEDPVRKARNTLDMIRNRYMLSENENEGAIARALPFAVIASRYEGFADELGISIVAEHHSDFDISDRYKALWKEYLDSLYKKKGDLILLYFVTYEWQIERHQAQCQIIERLQHAGLMNSQNLFPRGGNHATVRRNVEAFDRFMYARWEDSLMIKDPKGEERKREYRKFLRESERMYREEYPKWLAKEEVADVKEKA